MGRTSSQANHNRWVQVATIAEGTKKTRQTSNEMDRRHEETSRKLVNQNSEEQND